ncbi:alanine and arginine-rich domain-containing protein [Mustela putorius furo]|uniref:Alanine and arginine-rich domain-containing protein n=1 Tax=Mustela putorius furo TaxID=9669 RepID=A0A8U0S2A9_MUSPF|nr:alanine and arginine-rich domain-containing protein [Mustela putorius furo]
MGAGVSEMGPEDSHRRGRATAPGPPGVPGSDGPWPPAPRPARGSPGGSKSVNRQEEAHAARPRLEDLRRRQARAWPRTLPRGSSGRPRAEAGPEAEAEAPRDPPGTAHVGTVLAGLRAELLEMRFQNHQLAKTLLDLNKKMQRLKKEYELEIASKSQSSEHNVGNLE